jgi:hypothetical protein
MKFHGGTPISAGFHGTQPSIFMDEKWRGTPMTQETPIGTQFWISIVRWNHGQLWIESSVSQQFALQWVPKVFKSSIYYTGLLQAS